MVFWRDDELAEVGGWEKIWSQFWCLKGWMKVVCGVLRKVRPTLEKRVLEGPHGMF